MVKLKNRCRCKRTRTGNLARVVYANHGPEHLFSDTDRQAKFCGNAIISSRYTWYNFLPKNLFEQFHNMANIFFAVITVLYMFADSSTSIWANLGPLVAILLITMIKDGVEDILRHRRDRALNHAPIQLLQLDFTQQTASWVTKRAMNIRVGDVIRCDRGQAFPCDMVLLASSNPSTEVNVTTANLDGESNIKKYYAVSKTQSYYLAAADEDQLLLEAGRSFDQIAQDLYAKVECQGPTPDLTRFEGRLSTSRLDEQHIPLTFTNLVLRGAKLANTEFVLGLVVYTGKETKLSLNGKQSKRKYSSRESRSNIILLGFILSMTLLAIILTVVFTVWTDRNQDSIWYIPTARETPWEFVQNVFRFIFILNYLIPISIIITIEFQQMLLAFFISNDYQMYSPVDDLSSKANSAQLADELGQVEFLFSDKTGTLTQNVMLLRTCALIDPPRDEVYGFSATGSAGASPEGSPAQSQARAELNNFSSSSESEAEAEQTDDENGEAGATTKAGDQIKLNRRVPKRKVLRPVLEPEGRLEEFLTIITLCHTVEVTADQAQPHTNDPQSTRSDKVIPKYEAASPDEKALVEAAAEQGVVFMGCQPVEGSVSSKSYLIEFRYPERLTEQQQQQEQRGQRRQLPTGAQCQRRQYTVDAILEFDSTRKRMTVMVQHPDGTCHIHSKGAETAMLSAEVCVQSAGTAQTAALRYVNEFALDGLRTLVYSTRSVDRSVYGQLLAELHRASGLVGAQRVQAMHEAYRAIESDLMPVYVTGVEDKLQPGVRQCLQSLRESGIQIWILTGDKEETAIAVSQSAGHFSSQMSLIRLTNCPDFETAACMVFEQLEGIQSREDQRALSKRSRTQSTLLLPYSSPSPAVLNPTLDEVSEVVLTTVEQAEITETASKERRKKVQKLLHLKERLMGFVRIGRLGGARTHRRRHPSRPGVAGEPIGLVIDGKTLGFVLDPSLREAFLDLCMNVTTVLCCRMTPLQKASVVQLVQVGLGRNSTSRGTPVTAAVGDGGNDVAMLLQASVGVGIYGKEGREAARAGDYSIPEFRHLHRLFLVHGHWAYHRLTLTMNLFYFKCTALVTTQVLLQFYSGFSQNVDYDSLLFALYNLTMTSIACLLYGMFEQHLPERELMYRPYLYRVISNQANLRAWYVMLWIVEGLWQGTITFFISAIGLAGGLGYAPAVFIEPGLPPRAMFDFTLMGLANYIYLWISVNLRIAILTRHMNYIVLIGFVVTACNTGILFLYQETAGYDNMEFLGFTKLAQSPAFWFSLMLVLFIANVPSLCWRLVSDTWWSGQLRLSEIPQSRLRKKKRRSVRFWIESLVDGQRDKRPVEADDKP